MRSVVIEQAVRAPVERIWQACASAAGLRSWQADDIVGAVAPGAELVLGWPALGIALQLEVEHVEAQRRVVFAAASSRLELVIAPGRVQLTHTADFDEDERAGALASWQLSLGTLAHYLEHHDGEARSVHWAVARAKASFEDAHAFFTLPGAQSGWLTRTSTGTGIGAVGTEVALELAWGAPLTGRVLSHAASRDVLFSWREANESVVALRTLPSPSAAHERLLIATWSSWGLAETGTVAEQLTAAITRLARILEHRATA